MLYSPCVHGDFLVGFLPLPKNILVGEIIISKLSLAKNEHALCSVMDWCPVKDAFQHSHI